jgi:hypothetical protein
MASFEIGEQANIQIERARRLFGQQYLRHLGANIMQLDRHATNAVSLTSDT